MHAGVVRGGDDELGERRRLRRCRRRWEEREQRKSDEGDRARPPGRSDATRERRSHASQFR